MTRLRKAGYLMASNWNNVHVFISSTFNDMHAERDYLVKRVFPELYDWCERRKLRLIDIDLRWGITEHDAIHNKDVIKVCLDRIDDCRPFFLCFLGQRYGWVPEADDLSPATFAHYPLLAGTVGEASVTAMEIQHALNMPFRPRDVARERAQHSFFYFRDPSYLERMPGEPARLRRIFTDESEEDAALRQKLCGKLRELKERTIPDSGRPHRVYQCDWHAEAPYRTPELALPLTAPSTAPAAVNRWQREWEIAIGRPIPGATLSEDAPLREQADEYNHRLTQGRLADFRCETNATGQVAPLSQIILDDLKQAIQSQFPDHHEVADEDSLTQELDQHDEFRDNLTRGYIERPGVFDQLDAYLAQPDERRLLVLTADGGMGKSALLARWLQRRQPTRDNTLFISRFIGSGSRSTTVDGLLRYLLRELEELHGRGPFSLPADPLKLRRVWPTLVEAIGRGGPVLIVLDALDQLETGLLDVEWLPATLPPGLKMIVSFRRGGTQAEELLTRLHDSGQALLSEVPPLGELEDRRCLVRAYLGQYLKELDDYYIESCITAPGAHNPLYLKVVLSELRLFGSFASLHEQIHSTFGAGPDSAFQGFLQRLETDPAYTSLQPSKVVPLLFAALAHARHGLELAELTDIVLRNYPWPVEADLPDRAARQEAVVETLHLYLRQARPYLARRQGRYDFLYDSFQNAVLARYVSNAPAAGTIARPAAAWHQILVAMMERRGQRDPRTLRDYVYHLTEAGDDEGLRRCFGEGFLARKRDAGFPLDEVQADFRRGLDYFARKQDVGAMLAVACSYQSETESQQLPKYESYLIWLSSCLRQANDQLEIAQTIRFIDKQPAGFDRVRMAAEMLIGLGDHPQAGPFRDRLRTALEAMAATVEENGLDLLALEALGRLDACFHSALAPLRPSGQRLCRILKLVRRHPNHPQAAPVMQTLLQNVPGWSEGKADHDAVLASTGLLGRSVAADQVQWLAVRDLGRPRRRALESGVAMLSLSAFLADRPEMLDCVIEFAAAEPPFPPALLRATLVMAWFDQGLMGEPLVQRVLASRGAREDVLSGAWSARGRVLRATLSDLEFLQDAAMRYSIKPHEALLVPMFALWARLVTCVEDVPTDNLYGPTRMSYNYDACFQRDKRTFAEWIELGQALCCLGKSDAAQGLLAKFHTLAAETKQPARWSALALLGSVVLFLFFPLMMGAMAAAVSAVLLILAALALLILNLTGAAPQAAVVYRWLRGQPLPPWVLRSWEERHAQGQPPPMWAQYGNTWIWQILAVMFEDAGRPHLAAAIVASKAAEESGRFFRELRPRFFRQPTQLVALLSHYQQIKSQGDDPNREHWLRVARELLTLTQSRADGGFLMSALPLAAQGQLTLAHAIKITRRFHPARRAAIQSPHDIDELGATIASLTEPTDLWEACQAAGKIHLSDPHRLVAVLLQLGSSRPRSDFTELLYHISRWPGLADRDALRQMRASYVGVVRGEYRVPWCFRLAPLFQLLRGACWAKRITFREGYSRPSDFFMFTMKALWRKLTRW